MPQIFGGEDTWKRIEKFCARAVRAGRLCKIADTDFALARGKRIRAHRAKRDGLDGVDAHGTGNTLTAKSEWVQGKWGLSQQRNRPTGITPPRETMRGMSATQEMAIPPNRHRRSARPFPAIHCEADRGPGNIRMAMIVHSIHRTGT